MVEMAQFMKTHFKSLSVALLATFSLSSISAGTFAEATSPKKSVDLSTDKICGPYANLGTPPKRECYDAMSRSMTVMHRDMEAVSATGDVDYDFAAMMIPHHQGAIDMARAVLLEGKDPVLRRLAQQIITEQQTEIDVMRRQMAALHPKETLYAQADVKGVATDAPLAATISRNRVESVSVSSRDRVYTADQISNTISVIDPASNKLLGVIKLGDPFTAALSPL